MLEDIPSEWRKLVSVTLLMFTAYTRVQSPTNSLERLTLVIKDFKYLQC